MQYHDFTQDLMGGSEAARIIHRADGRGWLLLPALMRNSARRFGIHLSRPTMERLLRVTAYTWYADTLLDESPDKATARTVYRRLVQSSELVVQLNLTDWCDPPDQEHFLQDLLRLHGLFISSFEGMSRDRLNHLAFAIGDCAIVFARIHSVVPYASAQAREGRSY